MSLTTLDSDVTQEPARVVGIPKWCIAWKIWDSHNCRFKKTEKTRFPLDTRNCKFAFEKDANCCTEIADDLPRCTGILEWKISALCDRRLGVKTASDLLLWTEFPISLQPCSPPRPGTCNNTTVQILTPKVGRFNRCSGMLTGQCDEAQFVNFPNSLTLSTMIHKIVGLFFQVGLTRHALSGPDPRHVSAWPEESHEWTIEHVHFTTVATTRTSDLHGSTISKLTSKAAKLMPTVAMCCCVWSRDVLVTTEVLREIWPLTFRFWQIQELKAIQKALNSVKEISPVARHIENTT